jgi:hypothetical protein
VTSDRRFAVNFYATFLLNDLIPFEEHRHAQNADLQTGF